MKHLKKYNGEEKEEVIETINDILAEARDFKSVTSFGIDMIVIDPFVIYFTEKNH